MSTTEPKEHAQIKATTAMPVDKAVHTARENASSELSDAESLGPEARKGIKGMERITASWGWASLCIVYFVLWSSYLLWYFQRSFDRNLGPNITSLFGEHSYLATVQLAANIASGAIYMPMAKVLDKYGRVQAFVAMAVVTIVGLILTAACQNFATYCAGVVFTTVGFSALSYCVDVITADTSMLKSRALAYAYTGSPGIVTAFAGPKASSDLFAPGANWRWGYGALTIILPFLAAVLAYVLYAADRSSRSLSAADAPKESRHSLFQSLVAFLIDLDILGILIFVTGEVLFLLPFSLASTAPHSWSTGYIIAMIVLGFALLVGFPLYEKYGAKVPVAKWKLLTTGSLLIVVIVNALFSIAISTWDAYFTSYLRVVYGMSIEYAGYINSVSNVVSGIWTIFVGIMIRITGRYKWLLLISTPLYALFIGLLIYFRRPGTGIGYIVMCEIFLAFAQSTIILCVEVGTVADVSHEDVAVAIGLLGVSGYIGNALGDAIQGAIWTNSLPAELAKRLPANLQDQLQSIYGDIDQQLQYPMGSPARTAIIDSYAVAQTRMLVAGVVATVVMLVLIVFLKDIKLSNRQQVKGRVF